ncbi:adenylosuccinate lyase family protein [Vibrio sp. 1180_3]|uniref:class-II fumarase/aspartase family protein n=1 Tax=Vibrio sp. 1180_3 TaxID=2528832 RepID=UPI002406D085|nr:adenylosuccinate lyase family protein [Vibrio sp. 1180_3]MDF9399726.1 adenylosuccinate lyase family protein [Vibrio sp. 1180_3]
MKALYDSKSKTIDDRGLRDELSYHAKLQSYLDLEGALALAQGELGIIPAKAGKNIAKTCHMDNIDLEEMDRIYREIGHGFMPLIKVLVKACDEESGKYVHYGITTQNIQQSAQLYQLKKFHNKLLGFVEQSIHSLGKLAEKHQLSVMPGRTHGKHALPITYGYKVSVWIEELISAVERLKESEKRVFTVMMGGAVGAFHAMGPVGREVQDHVANQLGMHSMNIPSRNNRVYRAEYINNLALLATTFHKMAEEVYQTSSEEFGELSEAFKKGTVGSSTMPQKVNPKLAKGIIANSLKLYSVLTTTMYVAPRPFEADSSAYFVYDNSLQEAAELIAEVVIRAEELTRTIVINPEYMKKNVMITHGLINSEKIMMSLVERLGKDPAHELVYELAMESTHSGREYSEVLGDNSIMKENFTESEIQQLLDPLEYIGQCRETAVYWSEKAFAYRV